MAVVESSPLVGSSRSRMLGLISSSWPTLQRLRSPPLMPFRKNPAPPGPTTTLPAAFLLSSTLIFRKTKPVNTWHNELVCCLHDKMNLAPRHHDNPAHEMEGDITATQAYSKHQY